MFTHLPGALPYQPAPVRSMLLSAALTASTQLASKPHNCLTCHTVDRQLASHTGAPKLASHTPAFCRLPNFGQHAGGCMPAIQGASPATLPLTQPVQARAAVPPRQLIANDTKRHATQASALSMLKQVQQGRAPPPAPPRGPCGLSAPAPDRSHCCAASSSAQCTAVVKQGRQQLDAGVKAKKQLQPLLHSDNC